MTVVLSEDLVPLLEPTIARIGIERLSKRAAAVEGFVLRPESYFRRITDIRNGRAVTLDAHKADVLLLACNDDVLSLAQMPHFPRNRSQAYGMVIAFCETRGEALTPDAMNTIASSLVNFSNGVREEAIAASEAAQARLQQQRAYHQRKQALAA